MTLVLGAGILSLGVALAVSYEGDKVFGCLAITFLAVIVAGIMVLGMTTKDPRSERREKPEVLKETLKPEAQGVIVAEATRGKKIDGICRMMHVIVVVMFVTQVFCLVGLVVVAEKEIHAVEGRLEGELKNITVTQCVATSDKIRKEDRDTETVTITAVDKETGAGACRAALPISPPSSKSESDT